MNPMTSPPLPDSTGHATGSASPPVRPFVCHRSDLPLSLPGVLKRTSALCDCDALHLPCVSICPPLLLPGRLSCKRLGGGAASHSGWSGPPPDPREATPLPLRGSWRVAPICGWPVMRRRARTASFRVPSPGVYAPGWLACFRLSMPETPLPLIVLSPLVLRTNYLPPRGFSHIG